MASRRTSHGKDTTLDEPDVRGDAASPDDGLAQDGLSDDELAEEELAKDELADYTKLGRKSLRGSMLLLAGRLVSMVFTVATQVVMVRALSKEDYGVFAYAFALMAAGRILLSLGQGRLLSRFMSKYDEEQDYLRMFGSVLITVGTIMVTSTILLGGLAFFAEPLVAATFDEPNAVEVLLVLAFLAPLEALDQVFVSLFAVFSKPTAIFVRKYILTPSLRLGVVVVIAVSGGTVEQMALGYVLTSAFGIAIYMSLLIRVMRERGMMQHLRTDGVKLPFKDVFSFSFPTLTSELVFLATHLGSVMVLGATAGARAVAEFRAVLPAARLNQAVYQTFITLFLPMSARLHTRGDHDGVRETYWQTAHFMAVATFPILAMTTVFAEVTTVTLFGERYASSSSVLMVLAAGYYVSVSLGFNVYVLQIYGRLRFLMLSNVGVAIASVALAFVLIPRYGAVGAALTNASTLAGQNLVNQGVLLATLKRGGHPATYARPYLVVACVLAALIAVQVLFHPGIVGAFVTATVASLTVLRLTRDQIQLTKTLPMLKRIPGIERLTG
jgi:O-antigen/teichoic acid export membrane protein